MDTSTTYINMCGKAEEIQKSWIPRHGDYYFGIGSLHNHWKDDKDFYEIYLLADWDSEGGHFHLEPEHIDKQYATWIPRQDQLQEMLRKHEKQEYLDDLAATHNLVRYSLEHPEFHSMEQLWLAFVMKGKYKKTWVREDWTTLELKGGD